MTRVALLCSEALRPRMAGIGIRYLELARRLPPAGLEVVVVTPGEPEEVPALPDGAQIRRFERGGLAQVLADCDCAVAQGQLANDLVLEAPELPTVIDLYDPWLVENLHYSASLGLDPYRNDHATWVLQMSRGDFFLCSSDEQRHFYLGFLAALGRVNPRLLESDPDLQRLIAAVPFGLPDELPPHQPLLPPSPEGTRRLLFGGLYDWYDPWTLLEALALLEGEGREDWEVLLIRNPNPGSTPQRLFEEVEDWCRRRGWWESRVRALDWIPAERRYDLLRDVDLMVAPHRPSLETRLSLRTRFLDALIAGCPVVTSEGGAMSRLLMEHDAGWVVPPGDVAALSEALTAALDRPEEVARREAGGRRLVAGFSWDRVLAPLVAFCSDPQQDPTKADFAFRPPTQAPPDDLWFRLRRKIRRLLGGSS
ncbi:MAG: glycosyltransferase family 4 protein [Acidobacteriota bacterium]|nr:glycosyltransferase family 4 protein [Acidobacteriota bacterium]